MFKNESPLSFKNLILKLQDYIILAEILEKALGAEFVAHPVVELVGLFDRPIGSSALMFIYSECPF